MNVIKEHLAESENFKGFKSKYEKYLKQGNFEIGEDPFDICHTLQRMQINRPNFIGFIQEAYMKFINN